MQIKVNCVILIHAYADQTSQRKFANQSCVFIKMTSITTSKGISLEKKYLVHVYPNGVCKFQSKLNAV